MSKKKPAEKSTGILILGMHRSGTSALARVLNLLGVALGERLMPAGPGNESGHWESMAAYEAHEKLLTALGRRWDDFREMPSDWLQHPQTQLCAGAVRRFVVEELATQPLWAVKEPRLCRLMPMWRGALQGVPTRLTAVIVVRHPAEVAASLAKRDGIEHGHGYLLWAQHLLEAERATRDLPRVLVLYDQLLANWQSSAASAAQHLGLTWPRPSTEAAAAIDDFLRPQLRHHNALDRGAGDAQHMPALVQRLFATSVGVSEGAEGWDALAALSYEMQLAASLYGPCIDELVVTQQQKEARAIAAESVVVQGLINPQMLAQQSDLIRQSNQQSYATFAKSEQAGEILVELVRQVEAQRMESSHQALDVAQALFAQSQAQTQLQAAYDQLAEQMKGAMTLLAEREAQLVAHQEQARALLAEREVQLVAHQEQARALLAARETQFAVDQEQARAQMVERDRRLAALQSVHEDMLRAHVEEVLQLQQQAHAAKQVHDDAVSELRTALVQELARTEGLAHTSEALRVALHQASARTQDFELRLTATQRQVVEMLASTSWRLTAPLRFIRRLFGRKVAIPPAPTDVGSSYGGAAVSIRAHPRGSLRRHAGLLAEHVYRRMPLSIKRKRQMKGWLFRVAGPLLASTSPHRRWQADQRTHAPDTTIELSAALVALPPPSAPSAPGPTSPTSVGSAQETSATWCADGVREWAEYPALSARIEEERIQQREAKRPRAIPMLAVGSRRLADFAAEINLPPSSDTPDVTLLVPAYNHIATTLECLASIATHGHASRHSFEVLIADDGSTDETAQLLARVDNLRVISQPRNIGFLRNCNAAAKHARGRLLLLLNNDVQVTAGWLDALVQCLDASAEIAAVGPRIVYPSGWLQEAGARLLRDGSSEMIGLNDLPDLARYAFDRDVDYCSGACLLLRTDDFQSLNGFDERYAPAYCEDSDLCLRLREEGKRIVYCAGATVVHHLSTTSDAIPGDYKVRCIARNLTTFTARWQADLDHLDDVRTIAFYLPQFHPIPENDRWWGAGFTEWTNVAKARPNFVGHDQPRIPADMGYYDLRVPEVMERQAELARRYGIGGFCYYYYWFAGHRLLERPIEAMLASERPAFPFCLCWANENWTRRWDGEDHDVLMAQQHSEQDDVAVIRDLIRYFRSPHYIRIGGRPLIAVYRIALFPDFKRTAATWRQICRDEGIGDIYIAHVESFEMVSAGIKPADGGCDAAIEFPPHGMADPYPVTAPLLNPHFQGAVADYRDLAARYANRDLPSYKRFLGVATGWDNTARRQNNSYCFEHATPGAFQAWLEAAIKRTKQQFSGDERLLFVNAWNEWAEGAYLEPDRRFGHAYLQAHANARDASFLLQRNRHSLG